VGGEESKIYCIVVSARPTLYKVPRDLLLGNGEFMSVQELLSRAGSAKRDGLAEFFRQQESKARKYLSAIGRKGGKAKVAKGFAARSPAARVANAKKAAQTRWSKAD
jgi:hypothetical protein